jgi:DNA-binding LacI/PurR family transcriptional regulator
MSELKPVHVPLLADVAKAAGVSAPTVSRVLTGSKFVADELTERVLKAVRELGYRPNGAARATRSGRHDQVAIVTGGTANYGYAKTIEGIEQAARAAGFAVVVTVADSERPDAVGAVLDMVLTQPIAGVIALDFDRPGRAVLRAMPPHVPVVAAGGGARRSGAVARALIDEKVAAREAVDHLLSLGHGSVEHIAVPTMGKHSGRTEGWRAALAGAGLAVPKIMHATWEPASGYQWGEQIASDDTATAVFCGNDDLAIGVLRALADAGLRVPEDVSVVGFDDQPYAALWKPGLTTVRQDFHDLGRRAFSLLTRLLNGKAPGPASVATPALVVRESTGAPRRR